jgi:hypothetical protein
MMELVERGDQGVSKALVTAGAKREAEGATQSSRC